MNKNDANKKPKENEYAEVCIGQIIPTEKGIEMPPKYAYRIDFKGEDVMVIPLEGKWKTEKNAEKTRNTKNQKSISSKENKRKQEDDREQA